MNQPDTNEEVPVDLFSDLDDWVDNYINVQKDDFKDYMDSISTSPPQITNYSISHTNFQSTTPVTIISQISINNNEATNININYETTLNYGLFNNMHFVLIGDLSRDHDYLKELIKEHGGTVCNTHSKSKPCTVLVNNKFEYRQSSMITSKKFMTILERNVPLYKEQFLHDCINFKRKCELNNYLVLKQPVNNEQKYEPKKINCCEILSNGFECDIVEFENSRCKFCHYCNDDDERCFIERDMSIGNWKYCNLHLDTKK